MWSPTTTSDNKKREELDDCRCSSSAALDAAGVGSGQLQQQQQQQQPQQLNVFENNSKKQTSLFGGNLTTTTAGDEAAQIAKKEKELSGASIGAGGEAGDSGFISGPQSQNESQEQATHAQRDHNDGARGGGDDARKFNIPQTKSQQQQQQQQQQQRKSAEAAEKLVLDSGCIDEDYADDDDNDADYDEQYEVGKVVHPQQQQQQQQQQQSQVERQQSRATVASIADGDGAGAAGDAAADQMILKHENVIMSGVSERFCNLSLQGAVPRTTSQQLGGMNNLDAAGRRSTAISLNQSTSNKQHNQQAAGNSATQTTAPTTATTTTTTTPQATITPWEQYYQQNDDGDTYLHLACISGYVDVVAALIRMAPHPCLFNIQNDEAQTPLHLAALTAQPKILRMLLIAGANPTLRDRHGNTALHLACISGEEQCVRALTIPISASEIHEAHRQYGHRSNDEAVSYLSCASLPSDMEIRNYDGERCVHLAAQAGHIGILRILVLYGADINAREGKSGRTPLHIAIECCNEDLANFLLDDCQQTLNLETATYAGLTAYQVACALNKSQMQNILEKRGAEPLTPPDSDYDSSDIETDLDDSKLYDRFGDPGYFVSYNGGGNPMTVA